MSIRNEFSAFGAGDVSRSIRAQGHAKRALDVIAGSAALLFAAPLMAAIAIWVRFDSKGSVFFRQTRTGQDGRPFQIFKFRTMTVMEDGDAVHQAQRNDPRVTRAGGFLRSSSLDELPQLFNVLRGDMSLVGPRPHALAHDRQYIRLIGNYALRQTVKPGITGWAQVKGLRGETATVDAMRARVECDLWYAAHAGLALDLTILLRTFVEIFRNRNVY